MKKKLTKPKGKPKKKAKLKLQPVISTVRHTVPFPQGDAFTAIQIVQALAAERHAVAKEEPEGTESEYATSVCNGKRWLSMDTILNPAPPDNNLEADIKTMSKLDGIRGFFVVNIAKAVCGVRKLFRRTK